MSQQEKPILYNYFRSSCSARVRIALAIKGIEYEYRPIHLVNGDQTGAEYTKINPQAKVPTLIIDGNVLTQSVAIIEYLDEVYPEPALLPKDPAARAKVRSLTHSISSDIQPIQNFSVLAKVGETKQDWANHFITSGFEILEKEIESTHGKYSYGDNVTTIDLALYPQVYNAQRFKVDMKIFPLISKVYKNLESLEPFIKGDWKNQPDTPAELVPKSTKA